VASFRHTVTVPRTPDEVFPWLFEEDKVPQWTGSLDAYAVLGDGALGSGSRIRQTLEISGHKVDVEMEITRYEPPHEAESRFSMSGLDVVTAYKLSPNGAGTELTQTLEGNASGFKARMLVPVVQPRLEAKLTEDLERLRALLAS
jgi:uncharacterized protein YndB with AHSA1/START domain